FAFRRMIEQETARLAAANATPVQRERLRAAVAGRPNPLTEVIDFHDLIAEAAGNEFFRVIQKVIVALAGWHTPDEGLDDHDLELGSAAHAKVVERILAGDGDG